MRDGTHRSAALRLAGSMPSVPHSTSPSSVHQLSCSATAAAVSPTLDSSGPAAMNSASSAHAPRSAAVGVVTLALG